MKKRGRKDRKETKIAKNSVFFCDMGYQPVRSLRGSRTSW
jgi:hypothetical protein